jgi:hypothetical protein
MAAADRGQKISGGMKLFNMKEIKKNRQIQFLPDLIMGASGFCSSLSLMTSASLFQALRPQQHHFRLRSVTF